MPAVQKFYVLIFAAAILASGACSRPVIKEAKAADHDFYIGSMSSLKLVFRLDVWSHTRDIRLWELGSRDGRTSPQKGAFKYGRVPAEMQRVFPVRESVPAGPRRCEVVIVRIRFRDDGFMAPGNGSHTAAFRVNAAGRWAPMPVPSGVKKPIWNSAALREKFIAGLRGELTGPGRALFLREHESGSSIKRSIALLKTYAGETDTRKAYIHLRFQSELNLNSWKIDDISVLRDFKGLRKLYAGRNGIRDISALSGLTKLEILDLDENPLESGHALRGLGKLTLLSLVGTGIRDVRFAAGLKELRTLDISYNCVQDIAPLARLRKLFTANLAGNRIADATPLKGIPDLHFIQLQGNRIADAKPLADHFRGSKLGPGNDALLDLRDNPLKDTVELRRPWMKHVRVLYPGFAANLDENRPTRKAPACSSP